MSAQRLLRAEKRTRSAPSKGREEKRQRRHDGGGKEPRIACTHTGEQFCRASSLSEEDLLQNFSLFYKTANKEKQDESILRLMNISQPKRPRVDPSAARKDRTLSVTYFLLGKGSVDKVPVCKASFISVLCISKDRVARVCQYFAAHSAPRPELRGGARNVEENQAKRDSIRQHISQFQRRASRRVREDAAGRLYLPADLTIAKMYALFKEQNTQAQISYGLYYSVFKTDFKLGFGLPDAEASSACQGFGMKKERPQISDGEEEKNCTDGQLGAPVLPKTPGSVSESSRSACLGS